MTMEFKPVSAALKAFSMKDFASIYRALDMIEEVACLAAEREYAQDIRSPAGSYLTDLQEFLSKERFELVEHLRDRKEDDAHAEDIRVSLLVQFEAWCREFSKPTLKDLRASQLYRSAM